MKLRRRFLLISLSVFFSCEPEPALETAAYQPRLVIDGWIEQGDFPKVILGKSSSYYNEIDSATIRDLVATTAKVTVSDGEREEILTLKKDDRYFPPYVYTGTEIRGEVGKIYSLTVELKGELYAASTTIPAPAQLEQLWFEEAPRKDSLGYVHGKFTDNADETNYYRIFTMREGIDKRFIPVYLSTIGDQYFNGKTFTFSLLRGPETFTDVTDDLFYKRGDTVRIKFCTMDRAHFDFWRTLERELYLLGNPFSSSGNEIISNIDNNKALGVWGGYGVSYYRMVAK